MENSYTLNRGGFLPIASALAEGLSSGVQTYQQQKYRQAELALKQQQVTSETELRKLQMQKLQSEMGPVTFEAGKLQLLMKAQEAGMDVPGSVLKDQWNTVFEHIDNPMKLQAASQFVDKKAASSTETMDPTHFQEMFGSDSKLMPAQPASPASPSAEAQVPEVRPRVMNMAPVGPMARAAPTTPTGGAITFANPKEAEFYGGLVKSARQSQLGLGGLNAKADSTLATLLGGINKTTADLQKSQDTNEQRKYLAELKAKTAAYEAQLAAQSRENVANINAGSREKVAAKRGTGKGGSTKDPVLNNILKGINDLEKQEATIGKPNQLGMAPMDSVSEKQKDFLSQQKALLFNQYQSHTGKPYPGSAAPAAPGNVAPKTDPKKNPPAQPNTFSSGPGTGDKIRALPVNATFQVDGQTFIRTQSGYGPYVPQGN